MIVTTDPGWTLTPNPSYYVLFSDTATPAPAGFPNSAIVETVFQFLNSVFGRKNGSFMVIVVEVQAINTGFIGTVVLFIYLLRPISLAGYSSLAEERL